MLSGLGRRLVVDKQRTLWRELSIINPDTGDRAWLTGDGYSLHMLPGTRRTGNLGTKIQTDLQANTILTSSRDILCAVDLTHRIY